MAVLTNPEKTRIRIYVGDEEVTFVLNTPSTDALVRFLKDRYVSTRRGKIVDRSYEARIKFVDEHLYDVENVVYRDENGQIRPLNNTVEGWKEKIPASWKVSVAMHFEEKEEVEAPNS